MVKNEKHMIGLGIQSYVSYLKEYVKQLQDKKGQSRGDRVVIDLLIEHIKQLEIL